MLENIDENIPAILAKPIASAYIPTSCKVDNDLIKYLSKVVSPVYARPATIRGKPK
ncbi:hypothetical protein GCM10009411_36630 [Shewanella litoralis]|uniref:Uncharacterized protein n=1 Tax=Shewanella litoralis TaxID=2282700 RepID=A0ABQ2RMC7_9GAMM|nr:hypothetical protein GCM10009411_36630 [Shewanella litoralis]